MSDLRELLTAEAERLRPGVVPEFDALVGRAHRRRITRQLTVAGAVVAIVAGTTGAVLATRGNESPASVSLAGPVITQGECAGLTITAELVGRPGRWPVQAGVQPAPIEMPPNYLMWLRATGPCVGRLRISASNNRIQTATNGVTSFNDQGIGIIVSHVNPGDATVLLSLACDNEQNCDPTEIAAIPITVTDATSPTASPASTPAVDAANCPQRTSQPSANLQITATNKADGWFDHPCLDAPSGQTLRLTFTNNVYTLNGHAPVTLEGLYVFRSSDLPRVRPGVPFTWDFTKAIASNQGQPIDAGSTVEISVPPLDPGTYTVLVQPGYPQASATLTVS